MDPFGEIPELVELGQRHPTSPPLGSCVYYRARG
jgi:hypothetical protein